VGSHAVATAGGVAILVFPLGGTDPGESLAAADIDAANHCNFTAVEVLELREPLPADTQPVDMKRKGWRGWPDSNRRPAV
ncbi:MAG: hypothetical protein V3W37_06135, partial [Candidatus Binatia bacterium]